MVVLKNKKPVWNKKVGRYNLNFRGKASKSSAKNFIL
jgi:hypothetical protein